MKRCTHTLAHMQTSTALALIFSTLCTITVDTVIGTCNLIQWIVILQDMCTCIHTCTCVLAHTRTHICMTTFEPCTQAWVTAHKYVKNVHRAGKADEKSADCGNFRL